MNAPENVFSDWIAEQLRGDRLNESVSKSLYSSQMEEVGAELSGQLYEEFDRELTEKFGELPENFWSFGEDAAEGFYEGFMADLEGYMSDIIANIETRISDVTGSYVFGSSGGGGNTYSSSYVVQVQGGTSVNGELAAIHNAETLNKMRGGY
ncbi:MAG: hypothetical protein IJ366_09480 [Clostridia bacterium]|nr:hypothetical protein [Clostridia bacterium]